MKTILKAMFLLCVAGLPLSTIHAQKKEIIDDEAPNGIVIDRQSGRRDYPHHE